MIVAPILMIQWYNFFTKHFNSLQFRHLVLKSRATSLIKELECLNYSELDDIDQLIRHLLLFMINADKDISGTFSMDTIMQSNY